MITVNVKQRRILNPVKYLKIAYGWKCVIIIITLFKVDKNTNVVQVTSNKIAAISIDKG